MALKVIALDLFGTVFDMAGVPRDEIRAYLNQCVDPVWRPLELPESWKKLEPFPDAREGLSRIGAEYHIATCSNAPFSFQLPLFLDNMLTYSGLVGLEQIERYKPHPACYLHACEYMGVEPHEAMMVTANPTFGPYPFGDLEIAGAIGMQTQLIRNPGCPQTIIELAELLGC